MRFKYHKPEHCSRERQTANHSRKQRPKYYCETITAQSQNNNIRMLKLLHATQTTGSETRNNTNTKLEYVLQRTLTQPQNDYGTVLNRNAAKQTQTTSKQSSILHDRDTLRTSTSKVQQHSQAQSYDKPINLSDVTKHINANTIRRSCNFRKPKVPTQSKGRQQHKHKIASALHEQTAK